MRPLITLARYQIICIFVTPFQIQTWGRYNTPRAHRIRALLHPRRTFKGDQIDSERESEPVIFALISTGGDILSSNCPGTHSFERVSGNPRVGSGIGFDLGMIRELWSVFGSSFVPLWVSGSDDGRLRIVPPCID
ncbi:hypothetical protein CDAR_18881 [Caerostris darwini]|uniref:Uncharacterized protein n=1 Tax=Caerostris darwini TaxID=1538125 RepID=A0AAV4WD97_9ARAC|nr:hypothetical protein CDAR_18881 [Caerostris darwini]